MIECSVNTTQPRQAEIPEKPKPDSAKYQVDTDRGSYVMELTGNPSEADVMQVLSKLSDADLEALSTGSLSGVSDAGLELLVASSAPSKPNGGLSPQENAELQQLEAEYAASRHGKAGSRLTPQEQTELEQLESEYAASQKRQAAPANARSISSVGQSYPDESAAFSAFAGPAGVAPVAGLARYGAPLLQPQGGPGGLAAGSAGEALAQIIEGGEVSDKGAVASAGVTNAVPLAGVKAPFKVLQNVARMAAGAYAGEQVRSLIDEKKASEKAAKTAAIVAAITAASPLVGKALGRVIGNVAPEEAARVAAEQSRNATRDATLAAGREAGYVVPPSAVNPSWLNKRLESVAGKAALAQEAAVRNQEITNRLAKRSVGIPDETAITESVLEQVRKDFAAPYRDVAALSPEAAVSLEALKQARSDASTYYKHYSRSADPASLRSAKEASALAEKLENGLEDTANAAGKPELIPALREARKQIAKTFNVESGLNLGDSNISAPVLGRSLDRGAPLSDELETAARFQQAFPAFMREGAVVPSPGVSKVEAGLGAVLGLGTGALTKNPYIATAAAALPAVASPAARELALSPLYQRLMANRNYTPNTSSPGLTDEILARLGALAAAKELQRVEATESY